MKPFWDPGTGFDPLLEIFQVYNLSMGSLELRGKGDNDF
jgi:hypothetical protein